MFVRKYYRDFLYLINYYLSLESVSHTKLKNV